MQIRQIIPLEIVSTLDFVMPMIFNIRAMSNTFTGKGIYKHVLTFGGMTDVILYALQI